jgi:hypothetical protein
LRFGPQYALVGGGSAGLTITIPEAVIQSPALMKKWLAGLLVELSNVNAGQLATSGVSLGGGILSRVGEKPETLGNVEGEMKSAVLGQNMEERVIPVAKKLQGEWLDIPPEQWTWEKNQTFLNELIARSEAGIGHIFDIGYQVGRYHGPNAIYMKEKAFLEAHGFSRVFTGRWITVESGKKFRLYEWVKD